MRIPSGTTDQYIYFYAVDATDFTTPETGLSSFTVYRSRNGAAAAAMTTPTINETDSSNMAGVYGLLLDEDMTIDAGDDEQEMVFHISHAGMAPVVRTITLFRPKITAGYTLEVESDGDLTQVNTCVANSDMRGTDGASTHDANDVLTALGDGSWATEAGGTGDQFSAIPDMATATNQATIAGYIDTEIAAIVVALSNLNDPTAAAIADAVWDETSFGHDGAGSAGRQLWAVLDAVPNNSELEAAFTEIKGATWDSGDDTLEAIRDRGDAEWTTATGFAVAGSEMNLADDAITAAKFDESTAFPLKSADTGSTEVARTGADGDTLETISDQIDGVGGGGDATEAKQDTIISTLAIVAKTGNDGDTLETISDEIAALNVGGGSGAYTVTITVKDSGGDTVQNASVRMSYGAETRLQVSDSSGQVEFSCDGADWTVSITASGFTFTPQTLTVSANITQEYTLTTATPTTYYAENSDIYNIFGYENVIQWANNRELDTEHVDYDDHISSRLSTALAYGYEEINDFLRGGPYQIPFTGTAITLTIKRCNALLAGSWLFEWRRDSEDTDRYDKMENRARRILEELRKDVRRFDPAYQTTKGSRLPKVD
jgi:hypothetical protein